MSSEADRSARKKIVGAIIFLAASRVTRSFLQMIGLILIVKKFGPRMETDIFLMAQHGPVFIANLSKVAINVAFIPIFTAVLLKEKDEDVWTFASNTLNLLILLTVAFTLAYLGLAAGVLKSLGVAGVSGIEEVSFDFLFLTFLLLPAILLNPLFAFWESILYAKKDFYICGIAGVMIGVCEIASILLLSDKYGIKVIAIGISVGYLAQLLFVLPKFRSKVRHFGFSTTLDDPRVKRMFKLMIPVAYSVCLARISITTDLVLAAILGEGRITALTCAAKLSYLVPVIFATSVVIPMLGRYSEFIVEQKYDDLKKAMLRMTRIVFLTIIPFAVWIGVMNKPLVEFLFSSERFSADALRMVQAILLFLIPTIIFMSLNSVFRQVLLAMERRRFVMIEGTIIVIFNIVLSVILMQFMDVMGLAAGTSATAILDCGLMVYYFRRETGRFPQTGTALFLLKILLACLVMAMCVWFFAEHVGVSIPAGRGLYQAIFIAGSAIIGAAIYLLSASIFRAFRLTDPMSWAG